MPEMPYVLTKAQKAVLKRVVKTPRTASEIGEPLDKSGRGVARPINALLQLGLIKKIDGRPPTYQKVS